jgi:hypothetical protein
MRSVGEETLALSGAASSSLTDGSGAEENKKGGEELHCCERGED